MRIAIVSTPFVAVPPPGYGGTELVVDALAHTLAGSGHDVTVFATGDSRVPGLRACFARPVWPPEPYAELLHCRFAAREISTGAFDVVHAHIPAMLAFAGTLGVPLVYTIHHARDAALGRLETECRADVRRVAISARQAALHVPAPDHVVHHGLDPGLYPDAGEGGAQAFFLGRLSWCKGPELAVEAAREAGLPLFVAGDHHPGPDEPPLWAEGTLAPALRSPRVVWVRAAGLEAKRRAFARSRALLVPLRWEEPFGLVMIEAALAGCPVIAFPRGAAPEIVEEGVTGFLVEDVRGMAAALREAGRLDRRAIQARARLRFSARRMTADYLRVYRSAIRAAAAEAEAGRGRRRAGGGRPGGSGRGGGPRRRGGRVDDARALSPDPASPEALLGYSDPSSQPQATGTDKLVLKRGNLFLVANRLGDVAPAGARDLGLFLTDTRHLSAWRLSVEGGPPLCLSSQVSPEYIAQIDFTVTSLQEGDLLGHEPVNFVHLQRGQLIDDVFVDRLALSNFLARPVELWVELAWAADFADVFEVRGARRPVRGTYAAPRVEGDRVVLAYDGRDGRRYATEIRVDGAAPESAVGAPARLVALGARGARVAFHLAPGGTGEVTFSVAAGIERKARGVVRGPDEDRPLPLRETRPFAARAAGANLAYAAWSAQATRFVSSSPRLDAALAQAIADLKALNVFHFGEPVVSAGIPWYTCPFGRDALLTGFEALLAAPDVARDALRFLARLQGTRDDPERDEEPGKIPHEIRFGEMAAAGEVPHSPYYGSADATPLFVALLDEYERWTADAATVDALLPAAERALGWIDAATARDGLVWYERRTPKGLRNQGWKDSHDGVPFADGRPAEPPIALVEVQGYAVDARRRGADLLARRGRAADAERLRAAAAAHARLVEERFWLERAGTYAIALDRAGRQVDAVTSNAGHLLFSRVPGPERARRVAATLLAGGGWSGWGIRTLSAGQPAFNPLSYHGGTIWPHDNALIAWGLAAQGMTHEAARVFTALWGAAEHFRQLRLPELFCGLERTPDAFPVAYPVACSPQAWSSAAWFLLLRAVLGITPDAAAGRLHVTAPVLPPWLDALTLHGLRVGPSRVTLRFERGEGGGAAVELVSVEGPALRVRVDL